MPYGAITEYIDVAQVVLYAFFFFFFALVLYLRREDKREGYPLEGRERGRVKVQGFPPIPKPKTFLTRDGRTVQAPRADEVEREIQAKATWPHPGAPIEPLGDPLQSGIGPGSWVNRIDKPFLSFDGSPQVVPMRAAPGQKIPAMEVDPRGMDVIAADNRVAGRVSDVWVDKGEQYIRYLEMEVPAAPGETPKTVLLPIVFANISRRWRNIRVDALMSHQFVTVPPIKSPHQITALEEDKINAFYAGGLLYADPSRGEPLL